MFTFIEDYDVQETRRLAREEGISIGKLEGKQEGKIEGKIEGNTEGNLNGKLEDTISIIKEFQVTLSKAMSVTKVPESSRSRLKEELKRMNMIYEE
jgi:predicted transposase YdaD